NKAEFYMPPTIVAEIESFFENPHQKFLQKFIGNIIVKTPSLSEINISASLIGEIIGETRNRAFRGMKVGEEEISNAASLFMGKEELGKKEFQMAIGQIVTKYRDRYRNATRTGFIDSVADFELIMLARELNGVLISADEGVISWGRKFGVREMQPSVFGKKLLGYA
ncbi:MAG: RNA ligase partner protein, partial [Bacteroidetes bacterium]|nr:RNA ligase partner protein [Bacteroidota bacterium]